MIRTTALLALAAHGFADVTPNQIHIALAGDDGAGNSNGMAISWQTEDDTANTIVKYGTISGEYVESHSGSSTAYYETYHHHALMENLEPNTRYYYVVGDGETESAEFTFTSAPLSSSFQGNFTFGVVGDLGVTNGDDTLGYLTDHFSQMDLIWHAGDVSYADDSFLHKGCVFNFCYEQVWDEYMNLAQPFASAVPYMTSPGNHEADCHDPACLSDPERRDKLSNFTAYNTRFRMPSPESGGALNMHYSFNYGPVHFISLDTETGYPGAAEETRYIFPCGGFADQLTWLENDLIEANANRDVRPWIMANGHHPLYIGDSINAEFQAAMEDLFYEYGVDFYFSGHVHSYERDYPVYQGVVDPNGYNYPDATAYATVGGAGCDEMRGIQSEGNPEDLPEFVEPKPAAPLAEGELGTRTSEADGKWRASTSDGEWTAVTDTTHYGVARVTIMDKETLVFDYIQTETGDVADSVVLKKHH